jgi:hypothetical protein
MGMKGTKVVGRQGGRGGAPRDPQMLDWRSSWALSRVGALHGLLMKEMLVAACIVDGKKRSGDVWGADEEVGDMRADWLPVANQVWRASKLCQRRPATMKVLRIVKEEISWALDKHVIFTKERRMTIRYLQLHV